MKGKLGEWIPCSVGMPEEEGEYLVYYSCEVDGSVGDDKDCGYAISEYDSDMKSFGYWQKIFDPYSLGFIDTEFVSFDTAIAWMPLPEPYKGEK